MPMLINLFSFILTLLFFNAGKTLPPVNGSLSALAEDIAAEPSFKYGLWSVYVLDAESGEVLLNLNSEKTLAPASNLKLLTSAAALEFLGEDKRFQTTLGYQGTISGDGRLQGDLIIRGEGDPTLGSEEMPGVLALEPLLDDLVSKVREKGIRSVSGHLIADDSYLDYMPLPGEWYWTDIGNYYAAGTSGLCINENLYHLYFKPANSIGDTARVLRTEPPVPGLKFINHMKTGPAGSGDNGFIYAAPWQYDHQLEGTIPAGVNEFSIKGSLPDPAKFAAQWLARRLGESDIPVSGPPVTVRENGPLTGRETVFYTISSPPLSEIVYRLNKKSINLYADQLLKILGKEISHEGSFEAGAKLITDWLEENNIYSEGVFLYDGSGLSRADAVSTRLFAEFLAYVSRQPYFDTFYRSLGIAGDMDDISYMKNMGRGTRAEKNVRAKTGSITRVRAHSGYVHTRSQRLLCFSMIANNYNGTRGAVDRLHEKMMVALANLK
jgi:D-alanyl-D-alanine carboxypeptidase/D-alanyl-D-alanine-endopeptidase (penicillin-binding protein 4)